MIHRLCNIVHNNKEQIIAAIAHPSILPPLQLFPSSEIPVNSPIYQSSSCSSLFQNNCFDHSRCPLTSGFQVYLNIDTEDQIYQTVISHFRQNLEVTSIPNKG